MERSELEREMRETPLSLYDLRRSGGRNPSNQDLKFIYSTRATRGYRQLAISSKISCLEKKSYRDKLRLLSKIYGARVVVLHRAKT